MHKKIIILFLFLFLSLSLVTAQPPFNPVITEEGIDIIFPPFNMLETSVNQTFHFHAQNSSDGVFLTDSEVTCSFHLYNSTGEHIYKNDNDVAFDPPIDWEVLILGGNFSDVGSYGYVFECNSTALEIAGSVDIGLEANNYGVALTEAENDLFKGGIFLLVVFLIGSLVCVYKFENYIAKFVFYWTSHLFIILITFSVWQFTEGFAIGFVGIAGIFKILFYVFTIAVVPMIFLSMAWIFYIHAFNEHFQKLVDKGYDTERAFAMAKKKRGGWFNGQ